MTKFIIHGGSTGKTNIDNDSFFSEMTREINGKTLILLCYFSRKDNEVDKCFDQDKQRLIKNSKNKNLIFELAKEKTLRAQLVRANVFYMRGGNTAKLVEKLSQTKNISRLLKDKVIAGSSAGAYVLSKHYWENDTGKLGNGLGILNFKMLCHSLRDGRTDIAKKLLKYKKDLPLLTLPDYKWIVIFK